VSNPDPQFNSIAIVDDDAQVRVGLRSLLRSYGYNVDAYDGAAALLADNAPGRHQCIITDLQMPGMSGIELLEQLRRDGCQLPVILMTPSRSEPAQARLPERRTCFSANHLKRMNCCLPETGERKLRSGP
jgi:CheY-like chemotaxis protein